MSKEGEYFNLIWKKQYGKEWAQHYPGSRSAPTVVEDLVYAGTGMGILGCLKAGTGAVIAADNMLYYYNWGGELSLISCENGKLQKQGAFKLLYKVFGYFCRRKNIPVK